MRLSHAYAAAMRPYVKLLWPVVYVGCVVYVEVPTLHQACLRVLMDNVDGKFLYLHVPKK